MRRFHSYGPVESDIHFTVPREALVASCAEQLVGAEDGLEQYSHNAGTSSTCGIANRW